jgi:hypothetical protein
VPEEKGDLMTQEATDLAGLPVIPAARNAGCPLQPPAEFAEWRDAQDLQRAQWRGNPTCGKPLRRHKSEELRRRSERR